MKLKLSRREILYLLVGWLLVCMALMVGVYWFVQRNGPTALPVAEAGPPVPQATYTVEISSRTARELLPLAQDKANFWQADSQLVSATANWEEMSINLIGKPVAWTFRFYSPGVKRYYFVTVQADGRADGVSHGEPARRDPQLVVVDQWAVDSPQALNLWLNYGGSQMLTDTPGIRVVAQLKAPNEPDAPPTWTVAGYDSQGEAYHTVFINAQSGEVFDTKSGTES
jgi:uncharacterized iron-regulated membrane protein